MNGKVASFLYHEAELLDAGRLTQWLALFAADCSYYVHDSSIGYDVSPDNTLFYVADDHVRLKGRVERLGKRTAIAEQPASRTRHFVSNVQAVADGDTVFVTANQLVYRWRERTDLFSGLLRYRLRRTENSFLIQEKRFVLDAGDLRDQGRVSILL